MALRQFLYLDRKLVRDFLAQVEGGVIDESTAREKAAGKGGFGGKVGAGPLSLQGDKSRERSIETEATIRQVAASEFDRLYQYLETEGLLVLEEVSDLALLGNIRRKQFLEVDARIRISGLYKLLDLFKTFVAVAPVMEQLGAEVQIDDPQLAGMQALSALAGSDASIPVIASVPGSAGLQIGIELNPDGTFVGTWDMEASILLKVQRVIKGTEKYLVGDPLAGLLKLVPEEARSTLSASLNSPEALRFGLSGDMEIGAPGLLGTAIAIYR